MSAAGRLRVVVVRCSQLDAELCADVLFGMGAHAVEERLIDHEVSLRTTIDDDLSDIAAAMAGIAVELSDEFVDREVLDHWRKFVVPTGLDEGWSIVPKWLADDTSDEKHFVIDPEESFGVGDHPTTRLCANWLVKSEVSGKSLLDAGCGTGVLGIIAARRGAVVTGVDIAENALGATSRNAVLNSVHLHKVCRWEDLDGSERYGMIVANILAPVLIDLSSQLRTLIEPSGLIVLSGLRSEQKERVLRAYADLVLIGSDRIDGWELLVLQAP